MNDDHRTRESRKVDERPSARGDAAALLDALRREAATCTACGLYRHATQTVFGRGDARARMVLIGEQPGNDEDLSGRPFVGPAGRLLDRALAAAGIDRRSCYVTNAVKHFKWKGESRGKRRIHDTPSPREVEACRPWLDRELWAIEPRVIVCLGATAARAVLGRSVTIAAVRGRPQQSRDGRPTFVTIHPSAILRMREPAHRDAAMAAFTDDLRAAARARAPA